VHPRDRLIDATRTVRLFRCPVPYDDALVSRVLAEARADVQAELERVFARRRRTGYGPLYDLLADYPFREGKGLRPATCFAACRAVGWIGFHTPDGFRALFRAAGFARTAWIDLLPGFGLAVGQKAAGDLRAAAR
jgi:hypothetical protein